jgi:tetratricopeptide (TPR) repeat protein
MAGLKGVHPRLVTPLPDPRPSLAMLPPLKGLGDDFAWTVWYSVWKAYAVSQAAETADAVRDRFRAAAASVPELGDELAVLGRLAGGYEEPRVSSDALMRVGDWAAAQGYSEPAIQCAEAAAALVPGSARRALAAGRMNRLFGEVARAELFYERAIALARRTRNWRVYVRAHLGKGQVKKTLGDPEAARAHYYTAARAARSMSGEKWLAAQTQHDLHALAAEAGAIDEALDHARRALQWYPLHHPRLPALVHDIAFTLVRLHVLPPALQLLEAVMLTPVPPQDQVIGWSTLARAAGGAGDVAAYVRAAEHVLRGVALFDHQAAAAFDNLAWGACSLALWDDAKQYAARSLEIASRGAQTESLENACRALAFANARQIPATAQPTNEQLVEQLLQLSADAARRLTVWRGPTWKRKHQSGSEQLGRI